MLAEFIISLVASLLLAGLLFWLLLKRLRVNQNKANVLAPFYLLPVAIVIALLAVVALLILPRVRDVPHILADNYDVIETTVSDNMRLPTGILVNSRHYHLPARLLPPAGSRVRLYVTPFAGYVMRVDAIAPEPTDPAQ